FRGRLIHFEIILLNKLLMLGLCNKAFFSAKKQISRTELEHGFNDFIERLSYYTNQVDPNQLYIFTYFVFIREMMHHLRVEETQIL
ncbi:hypothetical protein ABTG05_12440, partial [Acinetobacter baumannii]